MLLAGIQAIASNSINGCVLTDMYFMTQQTNAEESSVISQVKLYTLLIPTFKRQRQVYLCEFKDGLVYIVSFQDSQGYITRLSQNQQNQPGKTTNNYFLNSQPKCIIFIFHVKKWKPITRNSVTRTRVHPRSTRKGWKLPGELIVSCREYHFYFYEQDTN